MKILVIDNYDSFTYNLVHLVKECGYRDVDVIRNDKFKLEEIDKYDKIILSPGPGIPSEAGLMPEAIKEYAASKSILGVCLGHQCIAEIFGAKLHNMQDVVHGKSSEVLIKDPNELIFKGLSKSIITGRYHSWSVSKENFPDTLEITAETEIGEIMALRHKEYDVRGVQFHPESILTSDGKTMISNWLKA